MKHTAKRDIYQEVTDKLIAQMEGGKLPWERPWMRAGSAGGLPFNLQSQKNYSGINVPILWCEAEQYGSNAWLTFNQCQTMGGMVRKGEKGTPIVFFKPWETTDKITGEDIKIPVIRQFYVFNREQCEGLPASDEAPVIPPASPKGAVLDMALRLNVDLHHGGDRAFFRPSADSVTMPHFHNFKSEAAYSATLAHELTHWTGHSTRLARDLSGMFGMEKYAKEELVAEMGSAFLMAELGIEYESRHHAAYLQSWLGAAKEDKKFLFQSAAAAQKAVHLLQGRVKMEEQDPDTEQANADKVEATQKIRAIKAALN